MLSAGGSNCGWHLQEGAFLNPLHSLNPSRIQQTLESCPGQLCFHLFLNNLRSLWSIVLVSTFMAYTPTSVGYMIQYPRTQHFRCSAWYRSFLKVVLFHLLGETFQLFLSYKIIFDFTLPQLSVSAAIMWFPTSVIHEELNEGNVWLGNPFYRL